jgi:hypothetical protein
MDICQAYLDALNDLMKTVTPLAIRAAMLMSLSLRMSVISKNYQFSVSIAEYALLSVSETIKPGTQVSKIFYYC